LNYFCAQIPSSSSFSSLTQLKPERIVKNVSTPNLTDLITEKEKPAAAPSFAQPNNRPNYSRTAFEPQEKLDPLKKNNLNDVFGEFLKSEGFNVAPSSKNQTIQEMRRQDMANSGMDPMALKVRLNTYFIAIKHNFQLIMINTLFNRSRLGQKGKRRIFVLYSQVSIQLLGLIVIGKK